MKANNATAAGPKIQEPEISVIDMTESDTLIHEHTNNDLNPNVKDNYRPIFDGLQVVFDNIEAAKAKEVRWVSEQKYIDASPRSEPDVSFLLTTRWFSEPRTRCWIPPV
ncbi:MAG: hypothetical protein U5N26_01900 [Candidatus Marinimicrobia bacterium]|nr:hypothetical protein [Candidatus Neomarinimicrobiota bacterium]